MGSLISIFTLNNYQNVKVIDNNLNHPKGCAVTLSAWAK
jgi:hypothetical protein